MPACTAFYPAHQPSGQAWTESGITLEYGKRFGGWGLAGGFIDHEIVDTPAEDGNRGKEFYVGCSYEGPLSPSFRVYRSRLPRRRPRPRSLLLRLHRQRSPSRPLSRRRHSGPWAQPAPVPVPTTIGNVESTTSFDVLGNERVAISLLATVFAGHRTLFGNHVAFGLRAVVER